MTFQVNTKKIEPKKEKEETKVIPLRNDRPLEQYELEAESNAVELSIKNFKRIHPLPGTLGYLFRDLMGGNQAVYNFVKNILPTSSYTGNGNPNKTGSAKEIKAKRIIAIWNIMDEFSQNRVDVFDWLCDKEGLARNDFYAFAAKGMFSHFEAITQRIMMETKPEVLHNTREFAKTERNFRDRELAAKATGLTKDAPIIGNIDASTKVNNNLSFSPNFNSVLREADNAVGEIIEGEIVNEPRQLSEGNSNYLNTGIKEESEEELLAVLRRK